MEKNELYIMGVFVIPKVADINFIYQVADINFIYQELSPRNVSVSIRHIFLTILSRLVFTTFSLCMCHVSGSSTSVFFVSLPGVGCIGLFCSLIFPSAFI